MKRGLCVFALVLIFSVSIVSADDIGYIYRKDFRVNDQIVDFISSKGHDVSLVQEENIVPSDYDLLIIGDEVYRELDFELIKDYPMLIISSHHGEELGLTDRDGISKIGSTSKLWVMHEGIEKEVYTQAFSHRRIAVPYYYIAYENMVSGWVSQAKTQSSGSGGSFGDVILYKEGNARKCFFGIAKAKYWTDESREMFGDCLDFVLNSVTQNVLECSLDSECGADIISEPFCSEISPGEFGVYQLNTINSCLQNQCSSMTDMALLEECDYGCESGVCLVAPMNSSSGGGSSGEMQMNETNQTDSGMNLSLVHDVEFVDLSNSVGKIRLEHTDGTDILEGENLQCSEKYKVVVWLENVGDFTEDISFSGSISELEFSHNAISGHEAGDRKLKTKTVNFSLSEGTHTVRVEAMIDGFSDFTPENNVVTRDFFVEC